MDRPDTHHRSMKVHGSQKPQVLSCGTMQGDKIVNRMGEDLGTVHEVMLDLERGRIAYVVLSTGGFLGMGDKLFAIPWNAMELDTDQKQFILDVDRERLKNSPGFDKNNWPDFAEVDWQDAKRQFYGSDWRNEDIDRDQDIDRDVA